MGRVRDFVIPAKAGIQRGWATEIRVRSGVKTAFIAVTHTSLDGRGLG